MKGYSRGTKQIYWQYGCQEHGESCPTRFRVRSNNRTKGKYEVHVQNPTACLSPLNQSSANQKVTLYPEDAVKDANMNAAIGVDNKQFSKSGRHYGVPEAAKENLNRLQYLSNPESVDKYLRDIFD